MDDAETITYILKTQSNEYYCGKTNNLSKRLLEHTREHYPRWFNSDKRRNFELLFKFEGDYEKFIKRAGISQITCLLKRRLD